MSYKKTPQTDPGIASKDGLNPRGRTFQEEAQMQEDNQRAAAESEEWQLAIAADIPGSGRVDDCAEMLRELGFEIGDDLGNGLRQVTQPVGWTKETQGYHTYVYDADGGQAFRMFHKGADYDQHKTRLIFGR